MALPRILGPISGSSIGRNARTLRAAIVALAALPSLANAQTVFGATERAQPSETISVNGSGFDGSAQVWGRYINDSGGQGSNIQFSLQGESSSCLVAQVPSNMLGRLWQVWVKTSGGQSSPVYVNRARPILVDTTDAVPNGLVRVFGRNMKAPGNVSETPAVRLLSGTTYINATVVASAPYSLTFRVPSTIRAGTSYRVFVRNGPGGTAGEVECPRQIVGTIVQKDYLGLNISWAAAIRYASNVYNIKTDPRLSVHAAGNGVTNDAPALRAAISIAKSVGGGVVYLPAGNYKVDDGTQIVLPSNVTLKGDGMGVTYLDFGYRFTPGNPAGGESWWLMLDVADLSGLMNMTLQNQNSGPVANQTVGRHWYTAPHAHRFFFSKVDFELGNGAFMYLEGTAKGVMQDCIVTTTNTTVGQQSGPVYLANIDEWIIRRNTFNYRVSRIYLLFTRHTIFEQNIVNRDNNYSGVAEGGGVETSFSQQIVVLNNTIRGTGPINHSNSDGEMFLSQDSTLPDVSDVGSVTAANATSVSNSARNWPSTLAAPGYGDAPRTVVRIISGKGAGQWRNVVSHSGSTLNVDAAWAVIPDNTSKYSLGSFSNYQQFILGNNISNGSKGIDIYDGACDTVIDSNNVTNAGHIEIRANDVAFTGAPGSTRRHDVGWNVEISNNGITDTDGVHMAQIVVAALNIGGVSYGNLVMGVDVRGNAVQTSVFNQQPDELGSTEGIWNSVVFEAYYDGRNSPGDNIGSVFQGNTCSGPGAAFHDVGTMLTVNAIGVGLGP